MTMQWCAFDCAIITDRGAACHEILDGSLG